MSLYLKSEEDTMKNEISLRLYIVFFYNQDAVFLAWAISNRIQTITIPEERRRKQASLD